MFYPSRAAVTGRPVTHGARAQGRIPRDRRGSRTNNPATGTGTVKLKSCPGCSGVGGSRSRDTFSIACYLTSLGSSLRRKTNKSRLEKDSHILSLSRCVFAVRQARRAASRLAWQATWQLFPSSMIPRRKIIVTQRTASIAMNSSLAARCSAWYHRNRKIIVTQLATNSSRKNS